MKKGVGEGVGRFEAGDLAYVTGKRDEMGNTEVAKIKEDGLYGETRIYVKKGSHFDEVQSIPKTITDDDVQVLTLGEIKNEGGIKKVHVRAVHDENREGWVHSHLIA